MAEVYGPTAAERDRPRRQVREAFRSTEGCGRRGLVRSTPTAPEARACVVDREKAALHGVAPPAVIQTLAAAGRGAQLGTFHVGARRGSRCPWSCSSRRRSGRASRQLLQLTVPGRAAPVPLSELVRAEEGRVDPPVFHKNLMPVAYVFGDLAGEIESPVYALVGAEQEARRAPRRGRRGGAAPRPRPPRGHRAARRSSGTASGTSRSRSSATSASPSPPCSSSSTSWWWAGSRASWSRSSSSCPSRSPSSASCPAHFGLGAFFTATSMIGFIAGAGIIVRNSIILVDFIELKLREGMPLAAAVEEAGVVRFRPMLLTAAAVIVGSAVMLADPIFQGLAVSLMAGAGGGDAALAARRAGPLLPRRAPRPRRRAAARGRAHPRSAPLRRSRPRAPSYSPCRSRGVAKACRPLPGRPAGGASSSRPPGTPAARRAAAPGRCRATPLAPWR